MLKERVHSGMSNKKVARGFMLVALILVLILSPFGNFSGLVHAAVEDDYEWSDNDDGTVTITEYKGNDTDLTIPDQLDAKDVTIIGKEAFRAKGLTSVTIPNSVTEIGAATFRDNHLTSLTLGNNITKIGNSAFWGNRLPSVTIPGSVTKIGDFAFNSNDITNIEIPSSVTEIGDSAFNNNNITSVTIPSSVEALGFAPFRNNALGTIQVDANNQNFKDIDGKGLYTMSDKVLIQGTTSGVIEDGTEEIVDSSFHGNELTEIMIPDSVTKIGTWAFGSNELSSVVIPDSVREIGNLAFQSNKLTEVTILNKDTNLIGSLFEFNQGNSEDLMIRGYYQSTAKKYADDKNKNHSFQGFNELTVDGDPLPVGKGQEVGVLNANNDLVATLQIPDHLDEDHSLYKSSLKVQEGIFGGVQGLIKSGEILDFTFVKTDNPNEEVSINEGDFELSLRVDNETVDTAIYHYENGEWEHIGGDIDNDFITATVHDFSEYGVFEKYVYVEDILDVDVEYEVGTKTLEDILSDLENQKVVVKHSDGTTEEIDVYWDDQSDPEYDKDKVGTYVFEGVVNYMEALSEYRVTLYEPERAEVALPTPKFSEAICDNPEVEVFISNQEGVNFEIQGTEDAGEIITIIAQPGDNVRLVATDGWIIDDNYGFYEHTFEALEDCEKEEPIKPDDEPEKGEEDNGNKLPKTASTHFNMIGVGLLTLLFGGVSYVLIRRRAL